MNKFIKVVCIAAVAAVGSSGVFAGPPHHHHHGSHHARELGAIGAGVLGAGLLAATIYDATHPAPVVVSQPVVVAPAPVVVAQPAVVAQPVGHYETRIQNVWVEGRYIDQVAANGAVVRMWQPGHYEQRSTQVFVTP